MPKLDLVNAKQIKSTHGEWLQAKSPLWTWAKPATHTPSQFYLNSAPLDVIGGTVVNLGPNQAIIDFNTSGRSHAAWTTGIPNGSSRWARFHISSETRVFARFTDNSDMGLTGAVTHLDGNPTLAGSGAKTVNVNPTLARGYFGLVAANGNGGRVILTNFLVTNTDGTV